MAITEPNSGTQTATVNTEHSLASALTTGIYQFAVDIDAMALGDVLELRVKEKVISTGTARTIYTAVQAHDPSADDNAWFSPAITIIHAGEFTLKQTAGTGRSYPWSVRKIA